MCGLVGLLDNRIVNADLSVFEQLLYADALRGFHSTGVAMFYRDFQKNEGGYSIIKRRGPAANLIVSREYDDWSREVNKKSVKMLMGHNRHATTGKINDESAHPFIAGDFILAHNGTLNNYTNLPNHYYFDIDSEAIAYSFADIGVEETIARLNGSFALTWVNIADQTFNICRNSQRPFALRTNKGYTQAAWASEERMLDWILGRKYRLNTLEESWDISPGQWIQFDLTSNKVADFTVSELELYKPKIISGGYSYNGDYYPNNNRKGGKQQNNKKGGGKNQNKPHAPGKGAKGEKSCNLPAKTNQEGKREQQKARTLREYGIEPGKRVKFYVFSFEPYNPSDSQPRGLIEGNMEDDPFLGVEVHCVDRDDFVDQAVYTGNPVAISTYNGYDVLICDDIELDSFIGEGSSVGNTKKVTEKGEETIETGIEEEADAFDEQDQGQELKYIGPTGRRMSKIDMNTICRFGCCHCDGDIDEHDYDSLGWSMSGFPICPNCVGFFDGAMTDGGMVH